MLFLKAAAHWRASFIPAPSHRATVLVAREILKGWSMSRMPHPRLIETASIAPEHHRLPAQTSSKYVHYVNTLDPERLTSKDYLDLSGRSSRDVFLTTRNIKRPGELTPMYGLETRNFPSTEYSTGTGGFLYLHRAPHGAPPTAAELRFRITNNPDPRSFSQGTDRMYYGLPWSRSVFWVYFTFLFSVLKRDGTYSAAIWNRIAAVHTFLYRNVDPHATQDRTFSQFTATLFSRSQPFVLHASCPQHHFWLLREVDGKDRLDRLDYDLPNYLLSPEEYANASALLKPQNRTPSISRTIYSGIAIVRFDWRGVENGKSLKIVLRILKVIEPIRPTIPGYAELVEGDIFPRTVLRPNPGRPERALRIGEGTPPTHAAARLFSLPDIPLYTDILG